MNILFSRTIVLQSAIFLLPLLSAAQKVALDGKKGEVIISGKIGNLNAPQQLWVYMGNEEWDTIPLKDGRFEYRKTTILPAYGAIMIKYKPYYEGVKGYNNFFGDMDLKSLFFEAGTMKISSPVDSVKHHAVITGSGIQEQQEQWLKKKSVITQQQREIAAAFNKASPEQLQSEAFLSEYERQSARIQERSDSLLSAEIKAHPRSLISQLAFMSYIRVNKDQLSPEKAREMFNLFPPDFKNSDAGKATLVTVEKLGKPAEVMKVPAAGEPATRFVQVDVKEKPADLKDSRGKYALPDAAGQSAPLEKAFPFELKDTLGRIVRLDDFKGKVLVMDFWFTGCKGCVQVAKGIHEGVMPAFERDTNVVFITVSIDINFLQWKKSIRTGRYTSNGQLNLYTMGMGSAHPLFRHYRFSGCPQILIITDKGETLSSSPQFPVISSRQSIEDFIGLVKMAGA